MADPRTADSKALKALANPLRQRILELLAASGPATSTTLAERLGVTSGGTSYNLRVLAENGFVQELPERARGRERWWRVADYDLRLPPAQEQDDPAKAAIGELHRLWLAGDTDLYERFERERPRLGEWADAIPYSRGAITVTLDELGDFFEAYLALLRRYQRPDGETPEGARRVETRMLAFPAPGGEEAGQD
ncbi:ArsR/SmtB family transcription factor [Amycolatopsis sp. VS8301801F10]|uniref:ArsR/SmtB family transcription factor n=1 Tax=Amycolatopsis sp. VS8301801F10 TaxID=2652442 RepID=UPI0038FD356F